MRSTVPVRSNTGCWTCRARRKKCDEKGQPCATCESLNLVCHGYGRRPEWMDGGAQERAQARAFKAVVKRSNTMRRQRKSQDISSLNRLEQPRRSRPDRDPQHRRIQSIGSDTQVNSEPQIHDAPFVSPISSRTPEISNAQYAERTYSVNPDHFQNDLTSIDDAMLALNGIGGSDEGSHQPFPFTEAFFGPASSPLSPSQYIGSFWDGFDESLQHQGEMTSIQGPFFSAPTTPFSSPVAAGNRGFPFPTVARQEIGISSIRKAPGKALDGPQELVSREYDALHYYTEAIFPSLFPFVAIHDRQIICQRLLTICCDSVICHNAVLSQSLCCQQSELSRFGLGSGCSEEVTTEHERLATEGLHDVLRKSIRTAGMPCKEGIQTELQVCASHVLLTQMLRGSSDWPRTIEAIGSFDPQEVDPTLNDSALGLDFYEFVLVYLEVLSCTFTTAEPKFAMKATQSFAATMFSQQLRRATGLEGWLLLNLMQITVLRRWKEDELAKGALSMAELVKRASSIEHDLQRHRQETLVNIDNVDNSIYSDSNQNRTAALRESAALTAIFATAATAFLHATVSDPRPQIPEIRQAVGDTVEALRRLPRPDLLRRLAWPVCIAACLADTSQHEFFERLARRVTEAYGRDENISRGLSVARECWALRGRAAVGEDRTYDWVDGMRSLGGTLLLF